MKWTDAAFRILTDEAAPLDYRELAKRIVDRKAVDASDEAGKPPVTLVDCHALFDLAADFQVSVRIETLPAYLENLDDVFAAKGST